MLLEVITTKPSIALRCKVIAGKFKATSCVLLMMVSEVGQCLMLFNFPLTSASGSWSLNCVRERISLKWYCLFCTQNSLIFSFPAMHLPWVREGRTRSSTSFLFLRETSLKLSEPDGFIAPERLILRIYSRVSECSPL